MDGSTRRETSHLTNVDATASSKLEQCLSPQNRNQAQLPKSLSPKIELRLRLLPKMAEMRLKKWITSEEESEFLKILTSKGSEGEDNRATEKVYRKLKQIERKHQQKKHKSESLNSLVNQEDSKRSTPKRALSRKRIKPISKDDMYQETENDDVQFLHGPRLLNPENCRELRLSDTDIQDLFVEMCFYARLRFLQPPCCLYCSYKNVQRPKSYESVKQRSSSLCNRLVLWRKDATKLLCKNNLDGSLVILRCQDAQSLLKGCVLSFGSGEWKWDLVSNKILVRQKI